MNATGPWRRVWRLGSATIAAVWLGAVSTPARAAVAPQVLKDLPYLAGADGEKLDLYLPGGRAVGARSPGVVYIHGGGWMHGDKGRPREREIATVLARAGYVCADINYVMGARSWPANLFDCKNAVRFLRANAGKYGVDPARIAVMGTSAGGHLALMTAYTAGEPGLEPSGPYPGVSSRVDAVVDLYGITDVLTRRKVTARGQPIDALNDAHTPAMLGVGRGQDPALWRLASPVAHVTAYVPPTLIIQGTADSIVDFGQSVELAGALRRAGVPYRLMLLAGVDHLFSLTRDRRGRPLRENVKAAVLDFLGRYSGGP